VITAISQGHNDARLLGSLAHLEAGPLAPRILLLDGARPAAGGALTNILAIVELDSPAGALVANALELYGALPFVLAVGTGLITWARFENGDRNWNTDCDVSGVAGSAPVRLDDPNVVAGGKVTLISARFR